MSDFKININNIPVNYTNKISYKLYERCSNSIISTENIQILNIDSTIYSLVSSYIGSNKSKLVITNVASTHPNLILNYNSNNVTPNTPLEIDITSLNDTDIIPNLEIDINIPIKKIIVDDEIGDDGDNDFDIDIDDLDGDNKDFLIYDNLPVQNQPEKSLLLDEINFNITHSINISFYIEDIYGTKGDVVTSSYQIKTVKCSQLSGITSNLPIISNHLGVINYQIESTGRPFIYYITGLPVGINYNRLTGLITGQSTLVGTYPIIINIRNEKGLSVTNTTLQITNNTILAPVITSTLNITIDKTSSGGNISSLDNNKFTYFMSADNLPLTYSFLIPIQLNSIINVSSINPALITAKIRALPLGVYNIIMEASNSVGSDTKTLVLTIT